MRGILFFVFIPLAVLMLGGNLWLNFRLLGAVEDSLSRWMGTEVTLSYSSLSVLTGNGHMGKLTVMNPPGFTPEPALVAEGAEVNLSVLSLFSDQVELDSVVLMRPTLYLAVNGERQRNLDVLLAQVEKFAAPLMVPILDGNGAQQGKPVRMRSLLLQKPGFFTAEAVQSRDKDSRQDWEDISLHPAGTQEKPVSGAWLLAEVLDGLRAKLPVAAEQNAAPQ